MGNEQEDMLKLTVRDFLAATAAKTPTPGGGSVAGVVGALAVALGEMSLNFTRGKKKFAEHEEFHSHLGGRLVKAREMFQELVTDDMAAYRLYQETTRREDGPEKEQAMELATAAAINVPREVTKLSLAVLDDLQSLVDRCNPWLISDLVAAAALGVAALRLSDYNVRINVPNLSDKAVGEELRESSRADLKRGIAAFEAIEQAAKPHLP
jgi:formiminotetrahydrofolate cyclodeaminase